MVLDPIPQILLNYLFLWSAFINPLQSLQSVVDQCFCQNLHGSFRKRNVKGKVKGKAPTSNLGNSFRFLSSDEFDPFGGITGFTPTLLENQIKCPLREFALRKLINFRSQKIVLRPEYKGGSMGKYFIYMIWLSSHHGKSIHDLALVRSCRSGVYMMSGFGGVMSSSGQIWSD